MERIEFENSTPIYFGIAIWGRDFCQKFLNHCLASLLASGNIPALPNKGKNKFLFCTTPEDWEWFKSQPLFIKLSQYLTPELMPLKVTDENDYENDQLAYKFHIVTQAHSDLVSRMYQDKTIGGLVFPDTLYAKDSFKSVFPQILKKNVKGILAHVPRLSTPVLLHKLHEEGYVKSDQPVEITNRALAHHALMNMNTEVLAQNWDNLYAFDFITDIWRYLPTHAGDGIVAHSFAWCPIFLDYSKLDSHNIKCLENNTIDGSYLYNNFKREDLYLVPDSDEFLMISYSPHTKLRIREKLIQTNPKINHLRKIAHWRKMIELSLGGFVDPLKLELLKFSVFMHAKDLTKEDFQMQKTTQYIVNQILSKPDTIEHWLEKFYSNKWVNKLLSASSKKINELSFTDRLIKEHTW